MWVYEDLVIMIELIRTGIRRLIAIILLPFTYPLLALFEWLFYNDGYSTANEFSHFLWHGELD